MDFAAATEMGAAAATAGPPNPAAESDASGGTAQQRPMGKQYRASLSGVLDQDEVGVLCLAALQQLCDDYGPTVRWPCKMWALRSWALVPHCHPASWYFSSSVNGAVWHSDT